MWQKSTRKFLIFLLDTNILEWKWAHLLPDGCRSLKPNYRHNGYLLLLQRLSLCQTKAHFRKFRGSRFRWRIWKIDCRKRGQGTIEGQKVQDNCFPTEKKNWITRLQRPFCSLCGKGENYKGRILYNSEKISHITLSSSRERKRNTRVIWAIT